MSKRRDQNQLLLDLARGEGPDVLHLPYSTEFEAVCQRINPAAETEDKHRIWEKFLELKGVDAPTAEADVPAHAAPATTSPPEQPAAPAKPPARFSRAPEERGLLFPVHDPIPELQPWSTPHEPDLTPEQAERRRNMLAGIANSYLATREQRVARILQRFPETRDSDTALCIRYWQTFQPDLFTSWLTL